MAIKCVTLNVWHGGRLLPAISDFLAAQHADIVLLQEVYNGTHPQLPAHLRSLRGWIAELGYPHTDFVPAFHEILPEGTIPQGNAILSKFPITARDHVFFNEPFRADYRDVPGQYEICPHVLQHVQLDTPAGEVNAFTFHGTWDLDGDNFSPKRRQMSDAIISAVKDKPNVLLGGDTNAKPTNPAMQRIGKHLHNVFGNELTTSFNLRHKDLKKLPGYATAVVDMLFVSPNVKVIEKSCPNVDVSDHLPLVVTVEIPRRSAGPGHL